MSTFTSTYSNPLDWNNHPLSGELKEGIHICASSNMSEGIKIAYPQYTNLCSINNLMKCLFPTWNSSEFILEQFLELSTWLQKNKSRFPSEELYTAFNANKKGIVMLMRKLTESGSNPEKLEKTFTDMKIRGQYISEKEIMFMEIWEALDNKNESDGTSYSAYRKKMLSNYLSIETLGDALLEINGPESKKISSSTPIFLHGFYFITPEQQFFLEQLIEKFNVIMFLYYEPRYASTFSFMDSFIRPKYKWKPISKKNIKSEA